MGKSNDRTVSNYLCINRKASLSFRVETEEAQCWHFSTGFSQRPVALKRLKDHLFSYEIHSLNAFIFCFTVFDSIRR